MFEYIKKKRKQIFIVQTNNESLFFRYFSWYWRIRKKKRRACMLICERKKTYMHEMDEHMEYSSGHIYRWSHFVFSNHWCTIFLDRMESCHDEAILRHLSSLLQTVYTRIFINNVNSAIRKNLRSLNTKNFKEITFIVKEIQIL